MIPKKMIYLLLLTSIILSLTACSTTGEPSQSSANPDIQNQQQPPAEMVIESKLAIGILKLEGTQTAVTSDQAKIMLPLWLAVKSLGKTANTTDVEMNALYQQIEDTLTAEQLQVIKDITITSDDQKALMEQYGIQIPQAPSNVDPNQIATRIASRSSEGGGMPGGVPGSGMGGGGGFAAGGIPGAASGQENLQVTPQARQFSRGGFRSGMNILFVDPLIKLLEQRASS